MNEEHLCHTCVNDWQECIGIKSVKLRLVLKVIKCDFYFKRPVHPVDYSYDRKEWDAEIKRQMGVEG